MKDSLDKTTWFLLGFMLGGVVGLIVAFLTPIVAFN